jgi:hypothetical protein
MFPPGGLYIESESMEMHLGQDSEEDVTVSRLIEIQRMLAESEDPFERLVCTLCAGGHAGATPCTVDGSSDWAIDVRCS